MSTLLPLLDESFQHILVHSGQHYSKSMDDIFFSDLQLRRPNYYLEVGSNSSGAQTACILEKFEKILLTECPSAIIVQGDTNTGLAGALAASKLKQSGCKIIHVEAGARSFNEYQVEEINRKIIDLISDLLIVSQDKDKSNLLSEGLGHKEIFVAGNTIVDSCKRILKTIKSLEILIKYNVEKENYIILTMHRQESVDNPLVLREICEALNEVGKYTTIIYPIHPRTKNNLEKYNISINAKGIKVIEPISYTEMIGLVANSRFCITDSGGVQEECAILQVPTLIIREETEWMQYVDIGLNSLIGRKKTNIINNSLLLLHDEKEYQRRKHLKIPYEKNITEKILKKIKEFLVN